VLLLVQPGHRAAINGAPALSVSVLRDGDELFLDDSPRIIRLAREGAVALGPPPAGALGMQCPVCRVAFSPASRVFVCDCQQPMHAEDPRLAEDALTCSALLEE
jgi:hypothetical protein